MLLYILRKFKVMCRLTSNATNAPLQILRFLYKLLFVLKIVVVCAHTSVIYCLVNAYVYLYSECLIVSQ